MAISFIGSATGTNTATMPAHVAGDLIVVFAYDFGTSSLAPTLVAGYTSLSSTNTTNTMGRRIAYKFAASSSETVGTWTNAQMLAVHVYRGVAAIGSSTFGGIQQSTNATYAATVLQNNKTSWLLFAAGTFSTTSTIENPPTGATLRQNIVDATGEIATFDTNGAYVGDWSLSVNVALGSNVFRDSHVIELIESPRAVTMQAGSYALSGADTPIIRPSPISFIGAATGSNTLTLPAHQAGDLIVFGAFNATGTTTPGFPTGFTSLVGGSGTTIAYNFSYKLATSSSETISVVSNTTQCVASVYRGVRQISPIGNAQPRTGTSSTVQYSSVSGLNATAGTNGSSWFGSFGFAKSTTSTVETPPLDMVLRANAVDATSEIAAFDRNAGATVMPAASVNVGASVVYATYTFEIRAPVNTNISPDPGSYAISGADTALARAYTITADPGSYMLSGADTPFIRSLLISAAPGAYALSGANTTLDTARYIIANPGSYALSGANTALQRSLIMSGAAGSYSLSGADTAALRSVIISAASGSYALSGANTAFEKGYVINADPGSYSINGANTSLIRAMNMIAAPGSYTLSGADTPIYRGLVIEPDAGSYSINGSDVVFELTVVSIRLKRYVGGVWETNRLKEYRDGDWVKPNLKRYVSGVWVQVND